MRVIRKSDLVEVPWKNGRGITREIAARFEGDRLLWRISMADVVEDGPFSEFDGLTRILTVIQGDGLLLHGPQRDWLASFAQPVTFDGGLPITAVLSEGPIQDLNLMFDTELLDVTAHSLKGPAQDTLGVPGQTCVVHLLSGTAQIGANTLSPADTVILDDAPQRFTLAPGAQALVFTIQRGSSAA